MRKKSKMKKMRLGQTIVAEREYAESESERLQAQRQVKRRRMHGVLTLVLMMVVLGLMAYLVVKETLGKEEVIEETEYKIVAQVVDEDNRGQMSMRVKSYIAQLEQDFRDAGYRVVKVTLPTGMSRELYVDLEGRDEYYKVNTDRGSAVTVEDVERMIRYLDEKDVHPEYVDVRVEGKAYYK